MKRPSRWLVAVIVIAIAAGGYWYSQNHLSEDAIAQEVKTTLQQQLDSGDLKEEHLQVAKVTLLHDQGNRYQAIATVVLDGKNHDVPLNVLVDGKKVAWQSDSGAFAFVAQAMMQKALADLQTKAAAAQADIEKAAAQIPAADAAIVIPESIKALTSQWQTLNESCRGGSGDNPATQKACDQRETVYTQIRAANWCWGHKDDDGASRTWVQCAPGDS